MKTNKRIAALVLCLALVCSLLPGVSLTAHAETLSGTCGAEGDNLTWTLDTDTGVLTIEGSGEMAYYDETPAPWYDYGEIITKVIFPDGLTSIGMFAFNGCSGLTDVSLPESLLSIGGAAFASCTALTEIAFPGRVWTIGDFAFRDCTALLSVSIPTNVMYIGSFAFGYVQDDEVGDYVKMDGFSIYGYLNTEAEYYANSNGIPFTALDEDPQDPGDVSGYCGSNGGHNLTWSLTFSTGVLTISGSGEMENYSIFAIPWYDYRDSITSVILCDGVTTVGLCAFRDCRALTTVVIPASLREIEELFSSFENCSSLTAFYVDPGNQWFSSLDGVLMNRAETQLLYYPAGKTKDFYAIPEGIKEIGYEAFIDSALAEVTIPETVTIVGGQAFYNCDAMKSVTIPASVRSIGGYAFGYHDDAETNDSFVKMEDFTIYGYENTAAQSYAERNEIPFVSLGAITTVSGSCGDNLTWTLNLVTGLLTIEGSGEIWLCAIEYDIPWYDYREKITAISLPDGLANVGSFAFNGCTRLTSVTIPDSVTKIEYCAFNGCTGLTDVSFPRSLEIIGKEAFCGCKELTGADLPEGLTTIGQEAFSGCYALTSVHFPSTLTTIDALAFYDAGLTEAVIPTGVKNLNPYVFWGCRALRSVTLPAGLESIGDWCFVGCDALAEINFSAGLKTIGVRAFNGCDGLSILILPEGLESIDAGAFLSCKGLTAVMLPESLTSIGEMAFFECPNLNAVMVPASVHTIEYHAFGYVNNQETWNEIKVEGFTVYGEKGSAAQIYAEENGFRFVPTQANNPFVDVKESDFFFMPVMWAVSATVTGGVDDTHFAPERTVMRADSMMFFWAANGRPGFSSTDKTFKDVKKTHWAYNAVMWAVENGITGGTNTEGTKFSPKQTCTRGEILQFLYAAEGKPRYHISNPYSDVKDKHWYKDGAIWAYENGLEKGENGKFQAKTPCTRGYVVTYLYRYFTGLELAQ